MEQRLSQKAESSSDQMLDQEASFLFTDDTSPNTMAVSQWIQQTVKAKRIL
jgi:uncharacterized protein Yka (UPF0111/DUF47 family)